MQRRSVTVYAPATISNLGSGFDVVGIAIDRPGDRVTAKRTGIPGLVFTMRTKESGLPTEPKENVAAHVALLMMDELTPLFGVRMTLHKKMPVGSGLGSSAASSVAAAVAVNALLAKPLPKKELLRYVVEGERKASAAPHADNVAPSLLGGACLIRSYNPLDVFQIPIRNTPVWIVVRPYLVIHTRDARKVVPKTIPLRKAVQQWGNVGGLVAGLMTGNAELIGKSVEDVIIEPARAHLIKGFYEVKAAALAAGAAGCSLSGSGPSMFAVAHSLREARIIANAIMLAFRNVSGAESEAFISRINLAGARIISIRG